MTQKQYSTYTLYSANTLADKVLMYDISETDPAEKLKLILFSDALKSLPDGTMLNGKISPSVASNNLTLALKTAGGSDASADDPIWIKINGTWRACTAALSVTKAAATNWANLGAETAANEVDLFAYVVWNTTPATDIVDLAWSRIPFGRVYSDFSGTTTNEKYLANANASAPAATDDCVNIGRFAATLSAGAGYTWTVPTYTSVNLIQTPTDKTRLLTWTPVHSRTGTAYTNLPTTSDAKYVLNGHELIFEERHTQNATPGGTGNQQFTLPFTQATGMYVPVSGSNETSAAVMSTFIVASDKLCRLLKYDATTDTTASNAYDAAGKILI